MGVLVRLRRLLGICRGERFLSEIVRCGLGEEERRVPLYLNRSYDTRRRRCAVCEPSPRQILQPIRVEHPAVTQTHSPAHHSRDLHVIAVPHQSMSASGTVTKARDILEIHFSSVQNAAKKSTPGNALKATSLRTKDVAKKSTSKHDLTRGQSPNEDIEPNPKKTVRPLLSFSFDPIPKAINCTTFQSTRDIAKDPSHPFHIRTRRRLESFDPTKLHWRVHVPYDVSKKSAIRNWAKKKIKRAFVNELKGLGSELDGSVREKEEDGSEGHEMGKALEKKQGVKGALLMILPSNPQEALTFTDEDAQRGVSFVLRKILEKQRGEQDPRPRSQKEYQRHRKPALSEQSKTSSLPAKAGFQPPSMR